MREKTGKRLERPFPAGGLFLSFPIFHPKNKTASYAGYDLTIKSSDKRKERKYDTDISLAGFLDRSALIIFLIQIAFNDEKFRVKFSY